MENLHGVFETLLAHNGKVYDLDLHLARLKKSAAIIGMRLPVGLGAIQGQLKNMRIRGAKRVRIVCTEKECGIEIAKLKKFPETGSAMFTSLTRTNPGAKALPYDKEHRAHAKAGKAGHIEALLVTKEENVTEGAYSNIFWVKDGILYTTGKNILLGITREKVLRLAKKLRVNVRIHDAKKSDLLDADEVFITKTLTGITPILKINETLIGSGKIGSITKKFITSLSAP